LREERAIREYRISPGPRRLPITTTWLILSILISIIFLIVGDLEVTGYPAFMKILLPISTHLAYAIIIATVVGLGLDRIFHYEHLVSLSDTLEAALATHTNRTDSAIRLAIRESASGYELKYLNDEQSIYNTIIENLSKHSFFSNTIISDTPIAPSNDRGAYYDKKIELINSGRLHCREIVSETVLPILDNYLNRVIPDRKGNLAIGKTRVNHELPDPINFCLFHNALQSFDDSLVLIGWVSDPESLLIQHTCIMTNHPDVIRLFASYFDVLQRASERHEY
jgi:hypothetical protein